MTTKDIEKQVLDAFREEHREQLEQIRTSLGALVLGMNVAGDERIQNAFRLAHSFKGGARVCNLREAERLGHSLEAIFEQLGRGRVKWTDETFATVNLVLDTIEDWMAALDEQQPLPDTAPALAAVDQVFPEASAKDTASVPSDLKSKLLKVFREEYAQQSDRLKQLVELWKIDAAKLGQEQVIEAGRIAHTLAGAAAVVEMCKIEAAARTLEDLFKEIGKKTRVSDVETRLQVEKCLEAMSEALREAESEAGCGVSSRPNPNPSDASASHPAADESRLEDSVHQESFDGIQLSSTQEHESVRVSVHCLDRLMRSSGELLTDSQRVEQFTRRFASFQQEIDELEREREGIRQFSSTSLHKLAGMTEFERIARYLESVDRRVIGLARRARQMAVEQRRTAWLLRARSQQVQQDVHETRLVPSHSVFHSFRKMVRDLAKSEGKEINFQVTGMDVRADRMVLQALKDSIMHMLRNSVCHGIESPETRREKGKAPTGNVALKLEIAAGKLHILVEDDGRGIDLKQVAFQAAQRGMIPGEEVAQLGDEELLSLVFRPGFSTSDSVTELSGRGMGLSIVHESVSRLQGVVKLVPNKEGGVCIDISVPISVSTHRVLLVACAGQTMAIPTQGIERLVRLKSREVETVEGRPVVMHNGRPIQLTRLANLLGFSESPNDDPTDMLSIVLLKSGLQCVAVSVEALLEERDAVVLDLDEFSESEKLTGAILLEDGQVAIVVQPSEILDRSRPEHFSYKSDSPKQMPKASAPKVLIVDDSFTTRTLEKNILEAHGYEVSVAVDGAEAISQMRQDKFALIISDIEMPRLDGFALLEQIKRDSRLSETPVILVTSRDRAEDQQRGLELGADAYIVKRKFDHQELLDTIQQVL